MKFSNKVIWKRVQKKNEWCWSKKQNYRKLTKRKGRLYKRHPPEIIKVLGKDCFRKQEWGWKEALDESCAFKNFFGSRGCFKERGKNRWDNYLCKNAVSTAQSAQSRARTLNRRRSKSRRLYVLDNICSVKIFFEINKGGWKYSAKNQSALRGVGVNSSESI